MAANQKEGELPVRRRTSGLSITTDLFHRRRPVKGEEDEQTRLGLQQLVGPSENPRATIIFVHGLGGHPIKTWSYKRDSNFVCIPSSPRICKLGLIFKCWPQEWLPHEPGLENVRICTFGYSADFAKAKESTVTILDFSKKLVLEVLIASADDAPIVFIAHSMGGLVVKKVGSNES
jgi:hypothetical protein